jgi:hypothetical protein
MPLQARFKCIAPAQGFVNRALLGPGHGTCHGTCQMHQVRADGGAAGEVFGTVTAMTCSPFATCAPTSLNHLGQFCAPRRRSPLFPCAHGVEAVTENSGLRRWSVSARRRTREHTNGIGGVPCRYRSGSTAKKKSCFAPSSNSGTDIQSRFWDCKLQDAYPPASPT